MSKSVLFACIALLWTHSAGALCSTDTDSGHLARRFCAIRERSAWRHEFLLPVDLLARAYSVVGDDARLRSFVHKLVLGKAVQYAHLGGSISVFALAKTKDANWHAMFHRWLELAFTPCGDQQPQLSAREPWPPYGSTLHVCPDSTITLVNHAIGATSCIFAEKCIAQRVNKTHTDWVMIEYTQNAIMGLNGESLDTPERRALERLLRKLLLLPSRPGITLVHSYSFNFGGNQYGDLVEDWHNLVVQYYGNVQTISMRSAVYDLLQQHNVTELQLYIGDGVHPAWLGHLLWADVMIYTFKQLAEEVMADILLHEAVPQAFAKSEGPPVREQDGVQLPLPKAFQDYFHDVAARTQSGLPPPLLDGNGEDSDGFCYMSEALQPLVQRGRHEDWSWVDESLVPGRHKWGFVSRTAGSKLVIEVDSTVGGILSGAATSAASGLPKGGGAQREVDTMKGVTRVNTTHAQVMLGYLSTYEDIGNARVSCLSGCSCEQHVVKALWTQRYSTTSFLYMMVSAHPQCQIQVEVLPPLQPGNSTKFKVEGIIINARPYYWDAAATASHYEFMVTDLFNNMN